MKTEIAYFGEEPDAAAKYGSKRQGLFQNGSPGPPATWAKVTSDGERESNITRDFLRPEKIDRPYNSVPISVQWGEQAQMRYNDRQFIVFSGTEVGLFLIDLDIDGVDT